MNMVNIPQKKFPWKALLRSAMTRILALVLILSVSATMMGSASKTKKTVAGEIDLGSYSQVPKNAVPDLYFWADGQVTYQKEPSVDEDKNIFQYAADSAVVDKYIAMLKKNGFKLVDTYDFSYKGSSFKSWGFVCNAMPKAEKVELQYKDSMCHISLYYSEKPGKYFMSVSPDLLVCDTGLRYDGSVADLRPGGESAGAGLIQLADGSYQTSDGRLKCSVGTAAVLRDGKTYTADATYEVDGGDEVIKIQNYYRNEGIYFQIPKDYMMQDDIYTQNEIRRWSWYEKNKMSDLESCKWGEAPMLAMPVNGHWRGATYNESNYQYQTFRVMLYDAGNVGVFYIASGFQKGTPSEVEALCAVELTDRTGLLEDATYIKKGNTATVKYGHHEFGTMWEVYDWTILEGADKIFIESVGSSCDVTGIRPGVAAVQVTYGYSKEEPDVLTGISCTVSRSKKQIYYFIVE